MISPSGGMQMRPVRQPCSRFPGLALPGHTRCFSSSRQVQSGPGDVIKEQYGSNWPGLKTSCAERLQSPCGPRSLARASALSFPSMSSSVPVGAVIGWMLLLTVKHIIADFVLQNSWMAHGKDQNKGWALPLLVHCLIHLAVALLLILIVAPKFWF